MSNASRGAVAKLEGGGSGGDSEEATSAEPMLMPCETETVLVIPLLDGGCSTDPPGFLSEEHVLTRSRQQASRVVRMNLANLPSTTSSNSRASGGGGGGGNEEAGEKRTRFSLSHDEGSIGNTSDNLGWGFNSLVKFMKNS